MAEVCKFVCSLCKYCTDRKSNFERHTRSAACLERRAKENRTVCQFCGLSFSTKYTRQRHESISCKERSISPNVDSTSPNVDSTSPKVNPISPNVDSDAMTIALLFACTKCPKTYAKKDKLELHMKKCTGTESSLQCHKCREIFASRSTKSRHLKICKGKQEYQLAIHGDHNSIVNTTNNTLNTTNNIDTQQNIGTQNNIVVMNFGNEKIDHITDDMKDRWLKLLNGKGIMKAIENVHFLEDCPENHNIKLDGNDRKILKVFHNDRWTRRATSEITDLLIENGRRMLMERYIESPVQEEDRDILTTDKQKKPNVYYNIVNQILAKVIDITEQFMKDENS